MSINEERRSEAFREFVEDVSARSDEISRNGFNLEAIKAFDREEKVEAEALLISAFNAGKPVAQAMGALGTSACIALLRTELRKVPVPSLFHADLALALFSSTNDSEILGELLKDIAISDQAPKMAVISHIGAAGWHEQSANKLLDLALQSDDGMVRGHSVVTAMEIGKVLSPSEKLGDPILPLVLAIEDGEESERKEAIERVREMIWASK